MLTVSSASDSDEDLIINGNSTDSEADIGMKIVRYGLEVFEQTPSCAAVLEPKCIRIHGESERLSALVEMATFWRYSTIVIRVCIGYKLLNFHKVRIFNAMQFTETCDNPAWSNCLPLCMCSVSEAGASDPRLP